jgi:hypothetical protein
LGCGSGVRCERKSELARETGFFVDEERPGMVAFGILDSLKIEGTELSLCNLME